MYSKIVCRKAGHVVISFSTISNMLGRPLGGGGGGGERGGGEGERGRGEGKRGRGRGRGRGGGVPCKKSLYYLLTL